MLDPARRRLLRLVAGRSAASPPTVSDLSAAVGGHPNTTRHHLRALVAAGMLAPEPTPAVGGRGRPATRYRATAAGREAASAGHGVAAVTEYVALAAAFAQRLAEREGDPGADARAIGRAWGTGLAARQDEEVDGADQALAARVIGLLDRLGFSPESERADAAGPVPGALSTTGPEPGTMVLLRTCPLLDAARRHPEVVCQVHLGLVAGALEALDEPADGVRLVPFARPGACELALPVTVVG